jgi:capsular polysaccharide biosynthesis protein
VKGLISVLRQKCCERSLQVRFAGFEPRQEELAVTLRDTVRILHARWVTVAVVVVAAMTIAVAWASLIQSTYTTSTRIFIATQSATDGQDAFSAAQLAQSRIVSYNDLIMSETLATRTVKRLRLQIAPRDLAKKVGASAKPDSVVITLSVTDPSATNAAFLANALSEDFVSMVHDLETTSTDSGPPAVRPLIVQRAVEAKIVSPHRSKVILFGLFVGLLLGPVVALLRGRPGTADRGENRDHREPVVMKRALSG